MRSEIKYLVPNALLHKLRSTIAPLVHLDKHGRDFKDTGYTIRSIYLDTPRFLYYKEKIDGLKDRKKLRLRAYNLPQHKGPVFLEIKRKSESRIKKTRAPIPVENLGAIFNPGQKVDLSTLIKADQETLTAANQFLYHVYRNNLQCSNLVVYEREAFEGKINPTLRITFDKNLRSKLAQDLSELYSESDMTAVLPGYFILEIKYNHAFPNWITPILSNFKLQKEALSKYCMGLEQCTGLKGADLLLSLSARYLRNTPLVAQKSVRTNADSEAGFKDFGEPC
ncbi:MAG: VTC domain-containing protein [Rhodothermales bacterium]